MRFLVVLALALLAPPALAQPPAREPVVAASGMVVCVSPPAADVGVAVLRKGGNAVDAAVAVAFVEAVTWPEAGNTMVLKDLGRTLRLIAENGPDAFYTGELADLLEKEMKAGGGLITRDDLAKYQAKERKPVRMTYRGYDVYAPPPPSSGGIGL